DSLTTTDAVVPAAEAAWGIGTQMLHDIAVASIVLGIPLIVSAWLAGPMRPATATRRVLAPWLREYPGMAYGAATLLLLLVIAWGPIPATRQVIPVIVFFALLMLGVYHPPRQTAEEYPDATASGARESLSAAARSLRSS